MLVKIAWLWKKDTEKQMWYLPTDSKLYKGDIINHCALYHCTLINKLQQVYCQHKNILRAWEKDQWG